MYGKKHSTGSGLGTLAAVAGGLALFNTVRTPAAVQQYTDAQYVALKAAKTASDLAAAAAQSGYDDLVISSDLAIAGLTSDLAQANIDLAASQQDLLQAQADLQDALDALDPLRLVAAEVLGDAEIQMRELATGQTTSCQSLSSWYFSLTPAQMAASTLSPIYNPAGETTVFSNNKLAIASLGEGIAVSVLNVNTGVVTSLTLGPLVATKVQLYGLGWTAPTP